METDFDYNAAIHKAQLGDRDSLDRLSKATQERLREDVYRLTLDDDLTEEIVQETMLQMLKVLDELKETDRFWPWLYKIARNKLRLQHRKQRQQKTVAAAAAKDPTTAKDCQTAISNMVGKELQEAVLRALRRLKSEHREVISMRCYREMEYSLIAESMGCSEFAAKMLFYRAKKSLKRQLVSEGFGRGSLLMALIVFGQMTSRTKAAAISVPATTLKVGATAGVVGLLTGKVAIIPLAAAGIVGAGSLMVASMPTPNGAEGVQPPPEPSVARAVDRQIEQYWYFYPAGVGGPVVIKAETQTKDKSKSCIFLQNAEANYIYDPADNTVSMVNHRQYNQDLSVWALPTDGPHRYGDAADLMMIDERTGTGRRTYRAEYSHALKDEYFQYSWPAGAKMIDNRDAMHKRGWTYFTVKGMVGGDRVTGTGRIPFVYSAAAEHGPWLRLDIGDQLVLIDDGRQAITRKAGKVTASYQAGSFFKGLSRPWMGLHTIDTVRRDAAERAIAYETQLRDNRQKAQVVLTRGKARLVYTIDMKTDVVESIKISRGDGERIELRFDYLQDVEQVSSRFAQPTINRNYGSKRRTNPGMLWLLQVLTGK
jgi:RNA polymerase sigma-70 factor (ECF subfamily)